MKEFILVFIKFIIMGLLGCILPLYALFVGIYLVDNIFVDIGCIIAAVYVIDKTCKFYRKNKHECIEAIENYKEKKEEEQ